MIHDTKTEVCSSSVLWSLGKYRNHLVAHFAGSVSWPGPGSRILLSVAVAGESPDQESVHGPRCGDNVSVMRHLIMSPVSNNKWFHQRFNVVWWGFTYNWNLNYLKFEFKVFLLTLSLVESKIEHSYCVIVN